MEDSACFRCSLHPWVLFCSGQLGEHPRAACVFNLSSSTPAWLSSAKDLGCPLLAVWWT